jgi:hypothetical protein
MWKKRSLRLLLGPLALLAALLGPLALLPPTGAYPARLTRAVSSYTVGGAGPMGIAQLQAGTAQTCAVGAAAVANGPGEWVLDYTQRISWEGSSSLSTSALRHW